MRIFLLALACFLTAALPAQERISLENPSFEDVPRPGQLPGGWNAVHCGPVDHTPPDIHPNDLPPYHFFGVKTRPQDGWTYLGMVTRASGESESVSQKLATPMQEGGRYQFSLYLARSEVYASGSRGEVDFSKGALLRIWGGMDACDKAELLALTVPVEYTQWLEYAFTLKPAQPWTHLTLEAWFAGEETYNGHLLLDNCSELFQLPAPPLKEELEAMDEAGLETAVLETIQKYRNLGQLADLTAIPFAGVCYKTHEFEQQVAKTGLRQFVLDAPFSELTSLIRSLEAIRLEKNLALVKEVVRLAQLNSREISPQEYQFFEKADMMFRENEALEPVRSKRLEFIRLHRGHIIEEISGL